MMTVGELIAELQKFPADAVCYAYEGEDIGIAIGEMGALGFIHAAEGDDDVSPATGEHLG